jgi:isopentenyl phosphate kinase
MAMNEVVFVKLGGSVITDKARPETARQDVIARLAEEVGRAARARPTMRLVLGHGSGSYGHAVAHRYGTRHGVRSEADWRGFAEVAAAAARLNRIVIDAFLLARSAVWSLQPSASARCRGGELVWLDVMAIEEALAHNLVPVVYGDVALDSLRGATIVSTEQILAYLSREIQPKQLVLVSDVDGVYAGDPMRDPSAEHIPEISAANWARVRAVLGRSHATDVTGGMLAKVEVMVELVKEMPELVVQIVSGERVGALEAALCNTGSSAGGTVIRWP